MSLTWNVAQREQATLGAAQIEASTAYKREIVMRRWNSEDGGVYVPAAADTSPNPCLFILPERDIVTPSGKLLTLMNPDYMTRHTGTGTEGVQRPRAHRRPEADPS